MTSQNLLIARIKQLSEEEIAALLDDASVMLGNTASNQNQTVLIVVLRTLSAMDINAANNVSSAGNVCGFYRNDTHHDVQFPLPVGNMVGSDRRHTLGQRNLLYRKEARPLSSGYF